MTTQTISEFDAYFLKIVGSIATAFWGRSSKICPKCGRQMNLYSTANHKRYLVCMEKHPNGFGSIPGCGYVLENLAIWFPAGD